MFTSARHRAGMGGEEEGVKGEWEGRKREVLP
jgi:hypothetical protein